MCQLVDVIWSADSDGVWFRTCCHDTPSLLQFFCRTSKLSQTIGSTRLLEFYCTEFQYSELHGIVTTSQKFECLPYWYFKRQIKMKVLDTKDIRS